MCQLLNGIITVNSRRHILKETTGHLPHLRVIITQTKDTPHPTRQVDRQIRILPGHFVEVVGQAITAVAHSLPDAELIEVTLRAHSGMPIHKTAAVEARPDQEKRQTRTQILAKTHHPIATAVIA